MIRFATRPAPAEPCRATLVARMADDIRELHFSGEGATPETLEHRGWSATLVERLGEEARALARRLSVRQIS